MQSVRRSAGDGAQLLTQVPAQRLAQPCHLLQRLIVDRLTGPAPQHRAQPSLRCAPGRAFFVAWLRVDQKPLLHTCTVFRGSPRCRYGRRRRAIGVQGFLMTAGADRAPAVTSKTESFAAMYRSWRDIS